jgi:HAMP domain-containing protein
MARIKDKMMRSILSSMAILLIGLGIIIGCYIYITEKENQLSRNLLTARSYANQIDSFINKYNAIAETLSFSQLNKDSFSRKEVLGLLKQIAINDKSVLGSWVIYEPNAFDQKDFQYVNTQGHDKTGRFIPYWNRLKGELVLEPVVDVETSDFYTTPRKTKEAFIPTPFIYEGVLMMSFCYPIIKDNFFRGVAGLDISIETVKKLLESFDQKKIYKSNYAYLVSESGILISTSNHLFDDYIINKKSISQIGQDLQFPQFEILSDKIKLREEGFINTKDPFSKEDTISFFSPIKTGNLTIIVSISKSDLLANTRKGIYILSFITIAILLIIGAILYFLIKTIIDPLNKLTDTVEQFGKQDFTARAQVSTDDEIGWLAKNFNSMANSIEDYSSTMEEKVKVRTLELNNSLVEITKLKYHQDGDYFLTSILLKPFFKKTPSTDRFKIDFLLEQKKTFEFKQKKLSIGGDLCYTDNIQLKGKSYIVILNGDAMGKSLQGAGGALILGSVFGMIIDRCKTHQETQNISPERWLKNTFIELHKTFETFGGLMLVSVVLGLIEEETSVMFYLNAEHPFTVLYRDGCASFIENDTHLRKLGTSLLDGKLFIKVFQLKANDIILIGSDGKDDLVLNAGSTEARIINEDETLFLRITEESKADIEKIKEKLSTYGELMDDLSIMRIEYTGIDSSSETKYLNTRVSTRKEAINLLEDRILTEPSPKALKRLAKLYIKDKEYEKAFSQISSFLSKSSSDTEALYIAAICLIKLNRYAESIEFCERCLLRDPLNERYLNLLNQAKEKTGIKKIQNFTETKNKILS